MCLLWSRIKQTSQVCTNRAHLRAVLLLALVQLLLLQQAQGGSVAKGMGRARSSKIASIHGLQAAAESLPTRAKDADATAAKATARAAGRYEIHAVSGEPNYKSVNLTWEVEFVSADDDNANNNNNANGATVTNSSSEVEPPKAFQIFYCEMQSFGPHRCRSKLVDESQHLDSEEVDEEGRANSGRQLRHYAVQIDNLRMATKYSFHIRPQQKRRNQRITGRSEIFNNEVDEETASSFGGQTIVIPTKGFSAQATKCLPHASEIEVETGPYFGGKIVVDGGNCGVKGNPDDPVDRYTMRIDHKMCGSLVKPETNTVETFITVQENLGIFTHSTRRFVVVCSFQSGMQTVRASFTVPGKEGVAAPVENDPFEPDDRAGRELRQMRYVDKSALVLKESRDGESGESEAALVQEVPDPALDARDARDAVAVLEDIVPGVNEQHIKHDDEDEAEVSESVTNGEEEEEQELTMEARPQKEAVRPVQQARLAKYAKLVVDQGEPTHRIDDWYNLELNGDRVAHKSALHHIANNFGSVVLTISLSVIMIGVFVYVVLRETRRQTLINANNMRQQHQQPRHPPQQQQQKPLPRALQQQQQQGSM